MGRPGPAVRPPLQVGASPTLPFCTVRRTSVEVEESLPLPVIEKIPSAAAVVRRAAVARRREFVNCMMSLLVVVDARKVIDEW